MAKVDLKKSAGFSLLLEDGELQPQDMEYYRKGTVEIDDIRPQLLNQELSYPEVFYHKYLGIDNDDIFSSKNLKVNIYQIPPNFAGIEFVKTRATRLPNHPKIVEVIYGGGTIVMQKMDEDNEKSDIIITKVKRDRKLIVPPGYDFTLVNTRNAQLIAIEVYNSETKHVSQLDSLKGLAYYVIRKNAKREIVRNPVYRNIPKHRKIKWEDIVDDYNITLKTPILKQILRKYDKFDWLFEENDLEI
jgi:oxalate decarboxylase/phosphoglucose isomerase-like protein (cupin superfamily)